MSAEEEFDGRRVALDDQMMAALGDRDSEYRQRVDALADAVIDVSRSHVAAGYTPYQTAERLMHILSQMVMVCARAHIAGRL